MCALQLIDDRKADRAIEDSIGRRSRAVMTCKGPRGWQAYKCEFAAGSKDSGELAVSLWLSADENPRSFPNPGETAGITFRLGHKKCMFAAEVLSVEAQTSKPRVRLAWPTRVEHLQRRAYERVEPPRGKIVAVRFWRDDAARSTAGGSEARNGQLEDISAGGLRVRVSDFTDIDVGATYKCVFAPAPGAQSLLVETMLRHHENLDQGRISLGFQVVGLETTRDGRRTLDQLARVVSHFQHAAARSSHRGNRPASNGAHRRRGSRY